MTVYYLTIGTVFVLTFLAINNSSKRKVTIVTKKIQQKNVWLFFAAALLVLVAGLRYGVGTDFFNYYWALETYPLKLWESIRSLNEPGFSVLASVLKNFTDDGAVFIFITAAITNGILLYTTYKYTDTYLFSSLLFIFVGVWHGMFNGVRQFFAAAIICLGHRYILDKKFWKYATCVFVAFLFHSSAVVMIIPYFMLRNKISFKNIAISAVGSVLLLGNYETIFSFVSTLKDETIDTTLSYMSAQVNTLRIVACIVPAVFILVLYLKSSIDQEQTFYINIVILYALLSVVGKNSPYLSRVNIYLLVLLPLAMGKLIVFKDKKSEFLEKIIITFLYFIFWYYEVSNSGDLNSFRFVWQR